MTKHLKSRALERKRISSISAQKQLVSTSQLLSFHWTRSTRAQNNHFTTTPLSTSNDVSRNLPGPRDGHPEQLRHPSRRFWQCHGHRQPLSYLPVRRVLCPCSSQARRPDPLQGLRSPCAVQRADQAVRFSFLGIIMRYARGPG